LFQILYVTFDSIWVGRFLGPQALAAVNVGFPIIFLMISLAIGFSMAVTILISQYYGARQEEMVERTIKNALFLMIIIGLVISISGVLLSRPLLQLIGTPAELLDNATLFLSVFFGGMLFFFGFGVINSVLMGLGDSLTPVKFLAFASVINIGLGPLLIIGIGPFPRMGVAGSALATVISQGVAFLLAVRYLNRSHHFLKFNRESFAFDREITAKIFKLGIPSSIQQSLVSIGMMVLQGIVNSFGPIVIAAYGVASRTLDNLAFLPAMTLSNTVAAFVGQNMGAGRDDRVKRIVFWASWMGAAIAGILTVVVMVVPKALISLFTSDPQIIAAGASYLRIVGWGYVPFSLLFIIHGVLRGAGDTFTTMILAFFSLWVFRLPLATWLAYGIGLGVNGVWIAIAVSSLLGMILSRAYYATGRWKRKVVARRRDTEPVEVAE
jgi:putative MATE family efflux protein